jgi:hypothetical protein
MRRPTDRSDPGTLSDALDRVANQLQRVHAHLFLAISRLRDTSSELRDALPRSATAISDDRGLAPSTRTVPAAVPAEALSGPSYGR